MMMRKIYKELLKKYKMANMHVIESAHGLFVYFLGLSVLSTHAPVEPNPDPLRQAAI
jgi:hypothetical protein